MAKSRWTIPFRQMAAMGVVAALTVALVWALKQYASIAIPAYVTWTVTTVVGFVVGYLTPSSGAGG